MLYNPIDNSKDIDLARHALIEASAGTGKTYTIENLVVRFIKEKDISLDNILILTFTEKAVGDLKTRIRTNLEKELKNTSNNPLKRHINSTVDSFDTAPIYTIHGFCHSLIRNFAFENGVLFQNEVIDDAPLFDKMLKEQMRKIWPRRYKNNLSGILGISGFNTQKKDFENLAIKIARKTYNSESMIRIEPDLKGRSHVNLTDQIISCLSRLKTLVGLPDGFSKSFDRLNIHKKSRRKVLDEIINPLEKYLAGFKPADFNIQIFEHFYSKLEKVKSQGKKGINCLTPKWLGKGPNIEECTQLEPVLNYLSQLDDLRFKIKYILLIETVDQLKKDVRSLKQSHGWISFDDMIDIVFKAVHNDKSSILLKTLRNQYKVTIVDEFHDTDPTQWKIFKKLFLDGPHKTVNKNLKNLLFLVGDPKQAIYSFRNADVYAYLEAKAEMQNLAKKGFARLYALKTNWRSRPELVKIFNNLFTHDGWFNHQGAADEFVISYLGSNSPKEDQLPDAIQSDKSNRPVLSIIDLQNAPKPQNAKLMLAEFIASEIDHLVNQGHIRLKEKGRSERDLNYGDICILIRNSSDVLLIEPALKKLKIPFSYYKKPNLFQSDEALILSYVFHGILNPGSNSDIKKCLLTPFFNYRLKDLLLLEKSILPRQVKEIFLNWNEYAGSRNWPALFQSLISDTGLIFREAIKPSWDRRYSNYKQILEYLQIVAYQKNLDFRGLTALLDGHRLKTINAGSEADIHQIESEECRVKIMTMHISKGLQFPVVFIAGGFTQNIKDDFFIYHTVDKKESPAVKKIIDVSRSSGKEKHLNEKEAENKRIFYVALTRAQFKLYLPYFPKNSNHRWLGPISKILSPSLFDCFGEHLINKDVRWLKPDHHSISVKKTIKRENRPNISGTLDTLLENRLPTGSDFRHRKIPIDSFTSLSVKNHPAFEQKFQFLHFNPLNINIREGDETDMSNLPVVDHMGDVQQTLPGGTDTGSMLHKILEEIPFNKIHEFSKKNDDPLMLKKDPEIKALITEQMSIFQIDPFWEREVHRIIFNSLTTPIFKNDETFSLCSLNNEDRSHEVAFFYTHPQPIEKNGLLFPDCEIQDGFIRGYIDMIFKHEGKYYIVDWKSNYISEGYHPQAIKRNMTDANYDLQYKIYTIALIRWLKKIKNTVDFRLSEYFGGVFYLYLRGMTGKNNDGVCFIPGKKIESLRNLEDEIHHELSRSMKRDTFHA